MSAVVGVELIEFDIEGPYEVSPDGRFVAGDVGRDFCVAEVAEIAGGRLDEDSSAQCVERSPRSISVARFSPDSRRVVFAPGPANPVPGPLTVIGVDGKVTVLAEPPEDAFGSDGSFVAPFFVDATTVAAGRMVNDRSSFEVVTFDLESSTGGEADTVEAPAGGAPPSGDVWVAGTELMVSLGDRREPDALLAFDPGKGAVSEVDLDTINGELDPDEPRPPAWQVHERAGDVALVRDVDVFLLVLDRPAWWLVRQDGTRGPVDPGGGDVWYAAISPDGATIAAYVADREGAGAGRTERVVVASTSAVLEGDATWSGIDVPDGYAPINQSDATMRALTWADDDRLLLRSRDGLYRFELE